MGANIGMQPTLLFPELPIIMEILTISLKQLSPGGIMVTGTPSPIACSHILCLLSHARNSCFHRIFALLPYMSSWLMGGWGDRADFVGDLLLSLLPALLE